MPLKNNQPALIIFLEDTNRDIIHSGLTDKLSNGDKDRLYGAFLEDTIYNCLNVSDVSLKVNIPSETAKDIVMEAVESLRPKIPVKLKTALEEGSFMRIIKEGESQGDRLRNAFKQAFDNGMSPVVLIGCVTPTLSKKVLKNAYLQLKKTDIVFGPTLEGSYYLIGMNKLHKGVLEKIDWDSEQTVYSQMVDIVTEKSSLVWRELDLWYDLRQPEDFEFLIRDINFFRQVGDEISASCTEEVLDDILKRIAD